MNAPYRGDPGAMALTYAGYAVDVVIDGAAATHAFESGRPALVLLDLMLPGVDGMTLLSRFRAHSSVPIIILTARGAVEDRVDGLNAGADDYLPKPFKFADLMARIQAVLRRQQVSLTRMLTVGEL